jgi:hypothetical protein
MVNLDVALLNFVVQVIINIVLISPALWISGRLLVGKEKAKFTDALATVVVGTLIGMIFGFFFQGIIASIIMFIIWLALVKHFFDCGWLKALAISIVAVLIFIVVAVILSLIGIGIGLGLGWIPV